MYADISRHNGDVIWGRFALPGVLLKLGGSDDGVYEDSKYAEEATAARAFNKHLGHYWFNGTGAAGSDAQFFVEHLAEYRDEDLLILDVEDMVGRPGTAWSPTKALTWFRTVRALKPKARLVVYMNSSTENTKNWSALVKFGVELWLAHYGVDDGTVAGSGTYTVKNWKSPLLVQFTDKGTAAGVVGNVDLSIASADLFPVAPAVEKDVMVSTAGSYIFSPKPAIALPTDKWLEVPIDDKNNLSFVIGYAGVVLVNAAFAFSGLPFGSTVQTRLEIVTIADGKTTGVAFSDVVELQGSGGNAFPAFSDSVVLTADQRLRLVLLAQQPGTQLLRSSVSVLRFLKG